MTLRPSRRSPFVGVLAACLVLSSSVPAAHAATVEWGTFTAAPGEVNHVTVQYPSAATVSFTDSGAALVAMDGCVSIDEHRADCTSPSPPPGFGLGFRVNAGDMNDSVDVSAVNLPHDCLAPAFIDGGPGDDVLLAPTSLGCWGGDIEAHGGPGDDVLQGGSAAYQLFGDEGDDVLFSDIPVFNSYHGGPGDDLIAGGAAGDYILGDAGVDLVDYSDRVDSVSVDLASVANDNGEDGEEDILGDIEGAIGGSGNDVLLGSDGPNLLSGGPGADQLIGGGGVDIADYSERTAGVTVVADDSPTSGNADDGAPGQRDSVAADVEDIWGGAGDDRLTGNAAANHLAGSGGSDLIDIRDSGPPDAASCGDGQDTALADAADVVGPDCEARALPAPLPAPAATPAPIVRPSPAATPPRSCPSLRSFVAQALRLRRGERLTKAVVVRRGAITRTLPRSHGTVRVDPAKLPKGTFSLRLTIRRHGKSHTVTRIHRSCPAG